MKKYLVIGNPIEHSLSPKLHNYWIKENNIKAVYEKMKLNEIDLEKKVLEVKKGTIQGLNVTVPYKKLIIPFLDELTLMSKRTNSVNTIFKKDNKVVGDNTDVGGFEKSLKHINYNVQNKKIFILGAGGVAPSIIFALQRLGALKITLSNRTKEKAENLKEIFPELETLDWGEIPNFNMIINATSVGLKGNDEIKLSYNKVGQNKLFYDVIYNPEKTNFLLKAKQSGNLVENGKMMFIYQAQLAFKIWHNILPKIDNNLLN
jgi:shikimate dehydrogenase